jgi:hypothetical protein
MAVLHITGLYMYAAEAARVPHGYFFFNDTATTEIYTQFGNPSLATQALIRVAKPSYTTGTLCEMEAKIFENSKNILDKMNI